jgi:hypothetical protein
MWSKWGGRLARGWLVASLVWMIVAAMPGQAGAACLSRQSAGPVFSPPFTDKCDNTGAGGTAEGTTYYACGTYCADPVGSDGISEPCNRWDYGCYYHTYWNCDSSCAGVGGSCTTSSQCGSGQCCRNGSCSTNCKGPQCNESYRVHCPAGQTATSTVLSTSCVSKGHLYWCNNGLGSAQTYNTTLRQFSTSPPGQCSCTEMAGECERSCWTNPKEG